MEGRLTYTEVCLEDMEVVLEGRKAANRISPNNPYRRHLIRHVPTNPLAGIDCAAAFQDVVKDNQNEMV
jgi:hypothetical protein